MDVLISCQGGEYTADIHPKLRKAGWTGYWIDAARHLRMADDAVIILDPVNRPVIDRALDRGVRDYIGGNCTVSLMLMAMDGLFRADLIEWMTSMTYQAASGGGAKHMRELVSQMGVAHDVGRRSARRSELVDSRHRSRGHRHAARRRLSCRAVRGSRWRAACCPGSTTISATARAARNGRRRPKATRFSAGRRQPIPIDGICVRIGSMRCHSQALTVKLRRDVPLGEIERMLATANDWVKVVPNEKDASLARSHADGGHRHARRAGRPTARSCRWAASICRRSPSAISSSGARPSRSAGCCASSSTRTPASSRRERGRS